MYIVVIQARMGSTRLPGKILKKLLDKEIIFWSYDRCKQANVDDVIIATSTNKENDILEEIFKSKNINYYRGSEDDLLDRYYQVAKKFNTDGLKIIRVTSDCPFVDPTIINDMINFYESNSFDYISNHSKDGIIPEGSGLEIFNFKFLKYLWENELDPAFREHATGLIRTTEKFNDKFNIGFYSYKPENIDINKYKLIKTSIDTLQDYEKAVYIVNKFNKYDFLYKDIFKYL